MRGARLGSWLVLGTICAGLLGIAGCGKAEDRDLAPWFRVRTTKYPGFGGLSSPSTQTDAYVRVYGFWLKLDEPGSGSFRLLTDATVFFGASGVPKLIDRGERHARLACTLPDAVATLPPGTGFIDCVDVVAGPARAVATQLHWRRTDAGARTLAEQPIAVEAPGRVFTQPAVVLYDERAVPHFVTMVDKDYATPRCSLIAVPSEGPRVVVAEAPLKMRDCSEARAWSQIAGYALRSASW